MGRIVGRCFPGARRLYAFNFISMIIFDILFSLYVVEAYGKANLIEPIPAYPESVVSICYTSVNTI